MGVQGCGSSEFYNVCLGYFVCPTLLKRRCCITKGHMWRKKKKTKNENEIKFFELKFFYASLLCELQPVIAGPRAWILLELADLGVSRVLFFCFVHLFIYFAAPYNINLYFYIPSVSPSAASPLNLRCLSLLLTISLLSPHRPPPPSSSPRCYFTHHFSV